jgi:hypothetical protein
VCVSYDLVHKNVDRVYFNNIEDDRRVDPGADGRIILGWSFRKWDVCGLD